MGKRRLINDYQDLPYEDFVGLLNTTSGKGETDLLHHSLAIASEAGEFCGKVMKEVYRGQVYSSESYISELGDILFSLTALINSYGVSLSELQEKNKEKLIDRYNRKVLHGDGDNR